MRPTKLILSGLLLGALALSCAASQQGKPAPAFIGLADKLVHSKVRAALGLDECRLQITSAAPISKSTLEFFLSLGIAIMEVYGM